MPINDQLVFISTSTRFQSFEGYFGQLKRQSIRKIYDASFTFLNQINYLSSVLLAKRGARSCETSHKRIVTGVRPMFMLMNVFRLLAENGELIGIPHTSRCKCLSAVQKTFIQPR